MQITKINSILQFITLSNGSKITLITNPSQGYTSKKNIGSKYPVTMWQYGSPHQSTKKLIDQTSKQYPFINNVIYV